MEGKRNPIALEIYYLGYSLANLKELLDHNFPWHLVKDELDRLKRYKFVTSLEFVGNNAEQYISWLSRDISDDSKPLGNKLSIWLRSMISEWEGQLNEVSKRWVISIPQVYLDIGKLNAGVQPFLQDEEFNILQPIERQGLDEGASCLLHNSFTSAEFIVLRIAESLLRRWYEKKTGNKLERQMWGEILDELNDLYPKKSERPKELSLLDYLRGRRNEIAHPEAISSPEEATATFLNVIAVCKAIKNELLR